MRGLWIASFALAAAASVFADPAGAGNLRDEQQVEIAPAMEGRQPAKRGLSIPVLTPKGQGAGSDRLAAGDAAGLDDDEDGALVDLPVTPDRRLGVVLAPGGSAPAVHGRDEQLSFAGMIRFRQALP